MILRAWREDDVEDAFALYGDLEVARYIGGNVTPDLETQGANLRKMIARYDRVGKGLGAFAMELKETGSVIGTTLLKPISRSEDWPAWQAWDPVANPDEPVPPYHEIEVGWHLARAYWGRGLAFEAAEGALLYGQVQLGLDEIQCVVFAENERSLALARRLGLVHRGSTERFYGANLQLFTSGPRSAEAN